MAGNGFAIYLFQIYPINVMTHIGLTLFEPPHSGSLLALMGLVQLAVALPLLVLVIEAAKRLLGGWSRPIIGA